jgi:hypothetical protein
LGGGVGDRTGCGSALSSVWVQMGLWVRVRVNKVYTENSLKGKSIKPQCLINDKKELMNNEISLIFH